MSVTQFQILDSYTYFTTTLHYTEKPFNFSYTLHGYQNPSYSKFCIPLPRTGPPFAPWFTPTQELAPESAPKIAPASRIKHPKQHDL